MAKTSPEEPKIELALTSSQMKKLVKTYQRILKTSSEAEAQKLLSDAAVSQALVGLPRASARFASHVARILGGSQ